jgi:hypothetical protein
MRMDICITDYLLTLGSSRVWTIHGLRPLTGTTYFLLAIQSLIFVYSTLKGMEPSFSIWS